MKLFHLGDVLSVTHDRLVSPRKITGVYDILNYMTGDSLFTHQLPRAARLCKPALLKQHPELDTGEMQLAIGELICGLESDSGKTEPGAMVTGWLAKQVAIYGEMLGVEPLEANEYTYIDPILEAEAMVGKDRVITINIPANEGN